MYLVVKRSIYCLTMPSNEWPEGVSDLVIRILVVAFNLSADKRYIAS